MPGERPDPVPRRGPGPRPAEGSLLRAAVWTGLGVAVAGALVAVVAVAVCWLPVSGAGHGSRTTATLHAGLITWLAALHGGVVVDGTHASWLPLGMLLGAAALAWRAGRSLADAAAERGEVRPRRLAHAVLALSGTVAAVALAASPFARLGTSRAPVVTSVAAAFVLTALVGGAAVASAAPYRDTCSRMLPAWVGPALRLGVAVVAVQLGAGALLVACSLASHAGTVEALSAQVGGGWGGVPVLLLGVLAAPNAAVDAASYLAGPGLSLGRGVDVGPFATGHGTMPAFPLLGAVPTGHGADLAALVLIGLTVAAVGLTAARLADRAGSPAAVASRLAAGSLVAAVLAAVCAWQAGGGLGGALSSIGASPLHFGAAMGALTLVPGALALLVLRAGRLVRRVVNHDSVDAHAPRSGRDVRLVPAPGVADTADGVTAATGIATADADADADSDAGDDAAVGEVAATAAGGRVAVPHTDDHDTEHLPRVAAARLPHGDGHDTDDHDTEHLPRVAGAGVPDEVTERLDAIARGLRRLAVAADGDAGPARGQADGRGELAG